MFKHKKDASEEGFEQTDDYNQTYGESDNTLKKNRSSCLIAVIIVLALVIGVVLIRIVQSRSTTLASQPRPTLTTSTGDGVPAQVAEGLIIASYSSSGERKWIHDLQGQDISADNSIPVSLPATISQNFLSNLNAIEYPQGAFFDPQSGQLVVFGPPAKSNSHPSSDDFLTALRAIYSQQDPAVSIDPAGSETTQTVRYLGQTNGTHFGWVMFESDRLMKTLSMGQDNITGQTITSTVLGYSTLLDLEFQIGENNQNEIRRRFWFTVPIAEIEQTDDGQSMVISALALDVKTEYLDSNWQTLANQLPDPAGKAFASRLTERYDEYAQEFPVLSDLKTLAYWTALAHWLKQANLPIQPELWLANSPALYGTPLTTPAITVTRQNTQGNIIQTMSLWGGVDLGMTLETHPATETTLARLKEIFDHFKSQLGFAKVNVSNPGLAIASVAPISLDQGLIDQVEIPVSSALQLNYSLDRWEFRLPRLQRYGLAKNSYFLLEDPSAISPVILTYGGHDTRKNAAVFINRQAGLWLDEFADSYQLTRGQFQSDGQFSHLADNFSIFDLQGQILQDSRATTGQVKYIYESGVLTSIQQSGQELAISSNSDGTVQSIQSGNQKISFEYKSGLLITLKDSVGSVVRRFEYDSRGRLTHEFDANDILERLTRYDGQNRILFQMDQNKATLYDWRPDGTLLQYSGAALMLWEQASDDDLEEMKIILHLRQNTQVNHILFARHIGDKVVVLANDRSYTVPDYMLKNPAGLRSKLASISGQDHFGDLLLISNQGIQGVAFQALFANAIPIDIEKMDEARITKNLGLLANHLTFTPQTTSVINGIPLPGQLEKVGLGSQDPNLWLDDASRTWKDRFDETFSQAGFVLQPNPSGQQIKTVLSTKRSVLIVVAHSDGQDIYLPNGTKFNPSTLSIQEKQAIAAQQPLVILLSCDTSASDAGVSFAQQLLDLGPRMVIAPNGKISAEKAHQILQVFFGNLKNDPDTLQAFIKSVKSVYENWLIPADDGLDHFFEILTQNISPDGLES